jgi:cold shock CspA family protein
MQGTIKFYDKSRGYGFALPDAPGLASMFFHYKDVLGLFTDDDRERELQPGVRITFEKGRDGRDRAVKVKLLHATMTDLHGNPAPTGKYSGFFKEPDDDDYR